MEARARAAVARLQELSQQAGGRRPRSRRRVVRASVDEAETISRTLLLAQRTADATIAEAQAEADRVLATARDEADGAPRQRPPGRDQPDRGVQGRGPQGRRGRAGAGRGRGAGAARPSRLPRSDVDHLEQHLVAQRERIVEAVASLTDLVNRVPDGLADMRRPLLSAAAESSSSSPSLGLGRRRRRSRRGRCRRGRRRRGPVRRRRAVGGGALGDRRDHEDRRGRADRRIGGRHAHGHGGAVRRGRRAHRAARRDTRDR